MVFRPGVHRDRLSHNSAGCSAYCEEVLQPHTWPEHPRSKAHTRCHCLSQGLVAGCRGACGYYSAPTNLMLTSTLAIHSATTMIGMGGVRDTAEIGEGSA